MADRVETAKALLDAKGSYARGCSGFVCQVLAIPWQDANALMGANPTPLGVTSSSSLLSPGDIIGWKKNPHGHVAVYIEPGKFIDVHTDGGEPRELSSYGGQPLFKSSRF